MANKLAAFYRRVHPSAYGWRPLARRFPDLPQVRDLRSNALDAMMGCILVYGCLFGIGKLVFGQWIAGTVLLALSAVAGYVIFWDLSRRGWVSLSGTGAEAVPPTSLEATEARSAT